MKGISAVIAAILMLMITMALAGVAYFYISGIFASKTTLIEAVGDADVSKPTAVTCDISWKVRNVGTTAVSISITSVTATGCTLAITSPQTITGGQTLTISTTGCTGINSNVAYKVAGPSNTVSLIAFCA